MARRARAEATELARLLVTRYGAQRVYLFGSLVASGPFRETSDIDLAAQGIPADLSPSTSFPWKHVRHPCAE